MGRILGVVVHSSASGIPGNPNEGIGTLNYCLTPGTASYNYLIDRDGTIYELVPPGTAAWHAEELNFRWLGVALAHSINTDPVTDGHHRSLDWLLRLLCQRYEIPRQRIGWLGSTSGARGIVEHRHTAQGQRWGKRDVGSNLDWSRLGL